MLNNMSNVPATNLLDDYLRATATGQQCCEQAVHSSQVPAQTAFLHNQVLQGVHQAIDSAAQGVRRSPDLTHVSSGLARGTAAAARAWSPVPSKHDPSSDSSQPATTPRGIFRAMRQADAAALYTEQLSAEQQHEPGGLSRSHHLQELHSDPVFAGTDSLASEVRLLAHHAERSSKLLRLQQDMEIKSYRQKLLDTLQQPSALFDGPRQPNQQQQHMQQLPQTCADGVPRCSSATMWHHSSSKMVQPEARPCTAPKPHTQHSAAAVHSAPAKPATAADSSSGAAAAYAGGLPSGLKQHQQYRQQPALSAPAAGYDSSSAGGLLAATAPPELQHLKILANLELPWRPPAAATATPGVSRALGSAGVRACSVHQQQHHQQQAQRAVPATAGSMCNGIAGMQLFLQADQQQQQECCGVPRPASALAALQQSLGELSKLKAKYSQLQDQQEQQQQLLRMQQEQRWQQQQQEDAERRAAKARRDARLQAEADLQLLQQQQHRTHTLHVASRAAQCGSSSNRACAWADQDTACGLGPRVGSTRQQQPHAVHGRAPYARWDTWQQQVHGQQQQQEFGAGGLFDAAGGVDRPLGSLGRQSAAQAAMRRSQSAPRLQRAWDAMPFESVHQHSNHSAEVGMGLGYRSRSPGARIPQRGHLGASWEEGVWQLHQQQQQQQRRSMLQELQRPKTAGARVGLGTAAGVGFGACVGGTRTAAAAATGSCGVREGPFSGWLSSSPLLKYTAGLRAAQGSAAAAAPTGRLGRGSAVHTMAGAQAAHSTLNGRAQGIGGGAAAATAGSWLPAGSRDGGIVGRSHQQQLQGTSVAGASSSQRLNQSAAATRSAAAANHSWLPQERGAAQGPLGACKAALLASRATGTAGAAAVGGSSGGWGRSDAGAATSGRVPAATTAAAGGGSGGGGGGSTSALRQELVQRALHGYKPQQVPRRTTANDDTSRIASDASSASSWGAAPGGSHSTRRESAYAAALARVRKAKQAARTGQRGGKRNNSGHDGDCSSSDDGGSTCG